MVHRHDFNLGTLQGTKAPFNHHQSLVPTGSIFQTDGIIIGFYDPLAVKSGRFPHRIPVNANQPGSGDAQIPFETPRGQKLNRPLSGGGMTLMLFEFSFQQQNSHFPVLFLSSGLPGIETQDIPAPSFTITDNHLFGIQIVTELRVTSAFAQDIPPDFRNTCHPAGKKIFSAGAGQFFSVVSGVHSGVCHKHRSSQVPPPKIGTDTLHCTDISGVSRENPTSDGYPIPGYSQSDNYLRSPGSFLAVAELPQRIVVGLIIFAVDMEGGCGCVIEDEVHFEVEQVGGAEENGLFNLIDMIVQQVHGFIHMPELEPFTGWEIYRRKPAVPNAEFGFRITQAVCHHCHQGTFIGNSCPHIFGDRVNGFFQTEFLPQRFHDQRASQKEGLADLHVTSQVIGQSRNTRFPRVGNLDPADTRNGMTQPDKILAIQLIGSSEVMYDSGNGFSGNRVSLVVSQLKILDGGTVLVCALCFS